MRRLLDAILYVLAALKVWRPARRLVVRVGSPIDAERPISAKWAEYLVLANGRVKMTVLLRGAPATPDGPKRQKAPFSVQPMDAAQQPARVDGPIDYSSSDPSIVDFDIVDDEGRSGFIVAQGPKGEVELTISADADLGDGVRKIEEKIRVIVDNEATGFGVTIGGAVDVDD